MLRGVVLLGLTAAAAGGIAGDIRSQLPHGPPQAQTATTVRLLPLENRLAIQDNQRAAWIAFRRAALAADRVDATLGFVGSLQARSEAAARLRDAAVALNALLTPPQRTAADILWAANNRRPGATRPPSSR